MTRNRYQFGLTLLTGFPVGDVGSSTALCGHAGNAFYQRPTAAYGLRCHFARRWSALFFLRWVFRPYRQLVGEAQKAQIQSRAPRSRDEAEFVLETFQSVVAQLSGTAQGTRAAESSSQQARRSAERFSERIVASVPSALIAFDGAGNSMVINAPGRALLGIDGGALGQPVGEILHNIPQLAQMVRDCLQSGKVYRREEIETMTTEQLPRRLGATVAPIELASERGPRGALCLLTDITEVTQLREQVALKKNLESLGEMSAGLAHEFKNAIATLHGYVQLLQSLELDERARGTASSLLNEVRNLSDMVTSFLNFARPQPLQLDEVNLDELIADCAGELAPTFKQCGVELVFAGTAGVSPASSDGSTSTAHSLVIRADERMLRQALLNLIRNAAEAISESQTDRRVEVLSSSERDPAGQHWAVVQIKDTGEGIPAADLQRIFIPFSQRRRQDMELARARTPRHYSTRRHVDSAEWKGWRRCVQFGCQPNFGLRGIRLRETNDVPHNFDVLSLHALSASSQF